jgi:hypothetical protein
MPTEPLLLTIVTAAALAGLVIAAAALLRGWQGWLDLKRAEIDVRRIDATPPPAVARIEIADLKERIRKLEAIAAGVDY